MDSIALRNILFWEETQKPRLQEGLFKRLNGVSWMTCEPFYSIKSPLPIGHPPLQIELL